MVQLAAQIVFNNLPKLSKELHDAASRVVRKTALDVLDHAQSTVPVDTGNLKNSLQPGSTDNVFEMEPGSLEAVVGTAVLYAAYVEFGTVKMAAQPYLIPAAESMKPVLIGAMQHLLKGA